MSPNTRPAAPTLCATACTTDATAETLNRACFCLAVDQAALQAELRAVLGEHGLPGVMAESHPHLFAGLPLHVSRRHIDQMAVVVAAIDKVTASAAYRSAVMTWAPDIACFDPGSPGGLLGLDFHLQPAGPRLIEINTNPGGALLNAVLGRAHRACLPESFVPPINVDRVEQAVLDALLAEWRLQRGGAPLQFIAIVDHAPDQQYLYPEFLLYQALFREHGYRAEICDPRDLVHRDNRLWLGAQPVDFVYNRLTDFDLHEPASAALRDAYLAGEVVLSPHPRAHALMADKRNLGVLRDGAVLVGSGVGPLASDALIAAVPETRVLTPANRDVMWAGRRQLFFKPAAGYGGKAGYRGDKLTRRVWDEIAGGTYVAQTIVPPSEREVGAGSDPLKVDIRCYAYRGHVLQYAARMYRGQTTNFRTPGGGFAPVVTDQLPTGSVSS